MSRSFSVGSLVRCRGRDWVVLPSEDERLLSLRPLSGCDTERCGVLLPFIKKGIEPVEPATFPLPDPSTVQDAEAVRLLFDASRLLLRDGAAPLRSLSRVSVRPRPYQFVPLLMALRQSPVRLLIADDVGIGKTIEALLVAREMYDRKEISRICILCPPYLCDQWQQELLVKFGIEAVVVKAGTVHKLDREIAGTVHSIFSYFPFVVASIDYVKMPNHRATFLTHCPDLVIVDEAHGAALGSGSGQQQRHELLRKIAGREGQHLVMLTATPHSGIEKAFLSLIKLLSPDFTDYDRLIREEEGRRELALHFVQRRRKDIASWPGGESPFPERICDEVAYSLSPAYRDLYGKVFVYSREMVKTSENLSQWKRRIRWWAALGLLRCVMSSPAAAVMALENIRKKKGFDEAEFESERDEAIDDSFRSYVHDGSGSEGSDLQPSHVIDSGTIDLPASERKQLFAFIEEAAAIQKKDKDTKILALVEIVRKQLDEGFHPVIWCRYIATANYVKEELVTRLKSKGLVVEAVTGEMDDQERRERVAALGDSQKRILVATDCLSEGINLQHLFSAVIHYDLPWNPNRMEQREGRVDRFGQSAPKVSAVVMYGKDNQVDKAVLEVLIRKARAIRTALGITVPVPDSAENLVDAMVRKIFYTDIQKSLFDFSDAVTEDGTSVASFEKDLDRAAERENQSRTVFAQASIKPEEVMSELEAVDQVLGDPDAVVRFVLSACQRLSCRAHLKDSGVLELQEVANLPVQVKSGLSEKMIAKNAALFSTKFPLPEGAQEIGRNHPFVSLLAEYIVSGCFSGEEESTGSRVGVIGTDLVKKPVYLYLLRCRASIEEPDRQPLLAEEIILSGIDGKKFLDEEKALDLLSSAEPVSNPTKQEKEDAIRSALSSFTDHIDGFNDLAEKRGELIRDAHVRIRKSAKLKIRGLSVTAHTPPDLIGVLVLVPGRRG